jgi:two-component system, NtrC family, nitrogen regulation sensor histidine kinase NtrY
MQIALYGGGASDAAFDPRQLLGPGGPVPEAARYQALIDRARKTGQQAAGVLDLTGRREDSASVTATPLKDEAGKVLAVLTVAISRSGMVQAQQHIRAIAYGVASAGILVSIVFSLWIAARVSRPIEQLARAAGQVARGNWEARVPVRGPHDPGAHQPARAPDTERAGCRLAGTGAPAGP